MHLESGLYCVFRFAHTRAIVNSQEKTLKGFRLYKRSIELLWGKGTLRKSSGNIQVISSIVPHCDIKTLGQSAFESCWLFLLAIWFIQDVSGQGSATFGILWMSAWQFMFCVLACFLCHWGLVHYLWQVLSDAKTLAVWLQWEWWPVDARGTWFNIVQHRSTSLNMMQLCLEVHQFSLVYRSKMIWC